MKVKDLLILPYAILKQLQKFCKPTDFRWAWFLITCYSALLNFLTVVVVMEKWREGIDYVHF